jgi:hypothetical protein
MTHRHRLLLLAVLLACGASAESKAQLPSKPGCAILTGGSAPHTANEGVNKVWLEADRQVSAGAAESMTGKGYTIHADFIEGSSNERVAKIAERMKETQCPETIDISIELQPPAGQAKLIVFRTLVFHLDRKNPMEVTVAGDFTKEYSYPLTKETLDTLSMSGVGKQFAADIDGAEVLAK